MSASFRHFFVVGIIAVAILGAGCSRQARISRYLERAERDFKAGDFDRAEIEFVNIYRLDPQHPAAIRRLGSIYFSQGRPTQAFAFLQRAEQFAPQDLEVRSMLATIYLAGRKFNEVRAEANSILKQDPRNDEAYVFLADSARNSNEVAQIRSTLEQLRSQGNQRCGFHVAVGTLAFREKKLREAESEFQQAVTLDSRNPLPHTALANLFLLTGKAKEAGQEFKMAYDLSPVRSSRRMDYMDYTARTGDRATAKQLLQETIQKAPDYLPALNRLAELSIAGKDFKEAASLLKSALMRDSQNFEALMLQGRLHLAQSDADKAIAQYGRVRAIYPRVASVQYQLALAHLTKSNTGEAASRLREAVSLDPDYADAILLLAELNLKKGDSVGAIALLSDLLKKRPDVPQAYLLLGAAHRARNNLESAMAVYEKLAESFPQTPQAPFLLGTVFLAQQSTNRAREAFEKSLRLAPEYLPALEQVIGLDLSERKFAAALERIQKEREKHPNAPELQILLAKTFFEQGQTNQVETALLKAIELNPNYREPYVILATFYVQQKQHRQAIARLESVISKNPQDITALMLLGTIYGELKDKNAERATYEKLLQANPRFSPALNNLAYLYSEHFNELDKAFQMAQRARELLPVNSESDISAAVAADTLGWILFKRHDYAWALGLLQESANVLSNHPEVLFHLGMARYMMGQEESARAAFNRALEIKRDFPGKSECIRNLATLDLDPNSSDPQRIPTLESQVAAHPQDTIALSRLAALYARTGATEKARGAYERALTVNPKNVNATIQLAELYAGRLKDGERAMELLRTARMLSPGDVSITHKLGRLAFQTGRVADVEWSLSLLQESARQMPDNGTVLFDLAWARYSLGQIADAETTMQAALKAPQRVADADAARRFLRFIDLAKNSSNVQGAVAETDQTLAGDPDYVPALFVRALLDEREGQALKAITRYQRIVDRYPAFTPAHKEMASLYLNDSAVADPQKAFEHASKARERQPSDSEAAKLLGMAAFKRGDFSKAAQLLKDSSRTRGEDAELFYYLGLAHFRLQQKSDSKKALNRALALNLPSGMAADAKRILPELN